MTTYTSLPDIDVLQGETVEITVRHLDEVGDPVAVASASGQVRPELIDLTEANGAPVAEFTVTDGTDEAKVFTIEGADIAAIEPGTYWYGLVMDDEPLAPARLTVGKVADDGS